MIAHFITSWLTQHVMPILPWVWLVVSLALTAWGYFMAPLLVARNWKTIAVVIVAGFCGIWVWQHFAVFADLRRQNDELKGQLQQTQQQVTNLNGSITNYTDGVQRIEEGQRQIRQDISRARVGLNSTTAIREARDANVGPVQASTNLSDRYNRLNGMFDDATGSFGTANPTAPRPSADHDAGGGVAGDPAGSNR